MVNDFNSIKELYERVKPALSIKLNEIKNQNKEELSEIDIWNYLTEKKWKKSTNLMLSDIVDDILNIELIDVNLDLLGKSQNFNENN